MQPYSLRTDLDDILSRKPELWESLRGSNLFLTGGTGWFGRWLLESIAHANAKLNTDILVKVLSRNPKQFAKLAPHLASNPAIRFHAGDITDFAYPNEFFSHIIHAATTSAHETFNGATPLSKFATLVNGTRRVLDFAVQCQAKQFLFTSSGVAYAPSQNGCLLFEDDDRAPITTEVNSALAQAKRSAEFLCSAYAEEQDWNLSIARCFSFVGAFMPLDIHYAIGNFIHQAIRNEPLIVKGDGLPVRSYLYSADLVIWMLTLLCRTGNPRLFNVGSDFAISIYDLASMVREIANPNGEVLCLSLPAYSVGNPIRNLYVPNIQRARTELGLDVWTSLSAAIQRTVAYYSISTNVIE